MSKSLLCAGALCISLLGVSGCFSPPATQQGEFTSNDLAKSLLGDTTWSDPQGRCELTFDEDAKLTSVTLPGLPEELESLNLTGEPFTVTIPANVELIGGQTLTLTVAPSSTDLTETDSGYTLDMGFSGTVSDNALAGFVDHVALNLSADVSADGSEVSEVEGEITVVGLLGLELFSASIDTNLGAPLTAAQ